MARYVPFDRMVTEPEEHGGESANGSQRRATECGEAFVYSGRSSKNTTAISDTQDTMIDALAKHQLLAKARVRSLALGRFSATYVYIDGVVHLIPPNSLTMADVEYSHDDFDVVRTDARFGGFEELKLKDGSTVRTRSHDSTTI